MKNIDESCFEWLNIYIKQPRIYVWAHELCHAWIADKLGYYKSFITVKHNNFKLKCSGTCYIENFNLSNKIEHSMVISAPCVFFLKEYTCDEYLKKEYAEAKQIFNEHLGRESTMGEFCTTVSSKVNKMLPSSKTLKQLTHQVSSFVNCYYGIENIYVYNISSKPIISTENISD